MSDIKNMHQINTNDPRESRVFADGKYVIKTPTAKNKSYIQAWHEKQIHAKNVTDSLSKMQHNGAGWVVPRVSEITDGDNTFVREERVNGKPLTSDLFSSLSPAEQERVYDYFIGFVSAMNQSQPVYNISHLLETPDDKGMVFTDVLAKLKSYLQGDDIEKLNRIYEFFNANQNMLPSLVFFHGDMNENNVFYDSESGTVSVIDFAEAKYENAEYMFNHDLIKLPWLNIQKAIDKYNKTEKKQLVRINSDPTMMKIFNQLRNIQWTGESLLARPNSVAVFSKILHENINDLEKLYQTVVANIAVRNKIADKRV